MAFLKTLYTALRSRVALDPYDDVAYDDDLESDVDFDTFSKSIMQDYAEALNYLETKSKFIETSDAYSHRTLANLQNALMRPANKYDYEGQAGLPRLAQSMAFGLSETDFSEQDKNERLSLLTYSLLSLWARRPWNKTER